MAQAQAASFGATAEVNYIRRYPVLNNTPSTPRSASSWCATGWATTAWWTNPEPVTASEDFAFFLEKVPGCYINIGNGVGSQGGCMVHNAGYDFNDRVLSHRAPPTGCYLIGLAMVFFTQQVHLPPEWRLFVITGFLGGLTTFSTFSAEVMRLLNEGRMAWALGAIGAHLAGSLLATWAGMVTATRLWRG
jgi:protein CrcB